MSILNVSYATREEIPAGYEALYAEKNGKFELTGVVGLQTDANVRRLENALNNERNAHKATKDRFRQIHFKGKSFAEMSDDDLQAAIAGLDRYEELEAGQGGDPKKIDELVEAKIKSRIAPVERERDALKTQLAERDKSIESYTAKDRQRAIHDAVRAAATKTNLLPTAVDDALGLAERIFDVGDDGQVTIKDQVGFTPGLAPSDWLSEIKEKRPHWWPESSGGGARGGRANGGGNPKQMKRAAFDALSAREKTETMRKGVTITD